MPGWKESVARTFNIETPVDPPSLLARARRAAKENGATFVGDESAGRFSHDMIKGKYRRVGETVVITITEKPFLVPWPLMEAQLREFVR